MKDLQSKIDKLDALIASTTHEGEKNAALLARERLLKKLRGKQKYQKAHHQKPPHKKKKHKHRKQAQEEQAQSPEEEIDDFFLDKNLKRKPADTQNATKRQKDYIEVLIVRAALMCPPDILDYFLNKLGFKQASKVIDELIERYGDPKKDPLTQRQKSFLKNHRRMEISEGFIEHLTVGEASTIIEAIKLIQKLSSW